MHYIPKLYNNIVLYRQHFTLDFVIPSFDLIVEIWKINSMSFSHVIKVDVKLFQKTYITD